MANCVLAVNAGPGRGTAAEPGLSLVPGETAKNTETRSSPPKAGGVRSA